MSLEDELREFVRREARAVFGELIPTRLPEVAQKVELDDETRKQIRRYAVLAHKPYLTKAEAALYLDVSEKSVEEWSARADADNPFPEDRAASAPRYNRMKIDGWVEREARRRREARA